MSGRRCSDVEVEGEWTGISEVAGGFGAIAGVREGEVDGDVSGISESGAPFAASRNNQSVKLGSV